MMPSIWLEEVADDFVRSGRLPLVLPDGVKYVRAEAYPLLHDMSMWESARLYILILVRDNNAVEVAVRDIPDEHRELGIKHGNPWS